MIDPNELASIGVDFLAWWTMTIGAFSILLKILEKLAKLTKSKRDDIKVAKLRKVFDFLESFSHGMALSPNKEDKKDL